MVFVENDEGFDSRGELLGNVEENSLVAFIEPCLFFEREIVDVSLILRACGITRLNSLVPSPSLLEANHTRCSPYYPLLPYSEAEVCP